MNATRLDIGEIEVPLSRRSVLPNPGVFALMSRRSPARREDGCSSSPISLPGDRFLIKPITGIP